MRSWRLSDEPVAADEDEDLRATRSACEGQGDRLPGLHLQPGVGWDARAIRYLLQNRKVDCLVTTAGGVEEDLIKCLAPHYMGDFSLKGSELRAKGINRIGNLLVPNRNYCLFEDWMSPLLDEMLEKQRAAAGEFYWSPSQMIHRFGEAINNEESICYWAFKNDIPIFCPAITDGSIGDMIYFHSFKSPGLVVDIAQDIRRLNNMALKAKRSGMLIFGGGLVKHHICNANLMRNGANYAVFVNTGQEFDGSDSGAKPDEAVSWGKVRMDATPVKIHADATLIMPLLVAQPLRASPRTTEKSGAPRGKRSGLEAVQKLCSFAFSPR